MARFTQTSLLEVTSALDVVTGQRISRTERDTQQYAAWRRTSLANPLVGTASEVAELGVARPAAVCGSGR
ncbi:hypothetical protein ASG82_23365 [Mycobacterium sp. Soil538]|nr:hypothetical protein ASG82_23365 [Mycobacterium sp. Soil538]